MNVYDWMKDNQDGPPLHEDNSREDPGHRPHLPEQEHHESDHAILDPQAQADLEETDMTSSNESIIEDVRKFFKMHNRGKDFVELDGNARANAAKIFGSIEKTFANPEWVDKQTQIKGNIKVSDLTDRINVDKLEDSIKEASAINDSYQDAIIAAQMPSVKQVAQLTKNWNASKLTDAMYEEAKKNLGTVQSMVDNVKKPSRSKTTLITGKKVDAVKPTLTPDETLSLAKTIIGAMKADFNRLTAANKEIAEELEKFWDVRWEVYENGEESESYNSQAWIDLTEAIARKIPARTPESMAAFRQFEEACVAAVVYMERSFKGGKAEVVEEVASNEGFMDTIKGLFSSKPKDLEVDDVERIIPALKETLLNESWLSKQTFTEGEVSVKLPDADIADLVTRVDAELQKAGKENGKRTNAWIRPFSKVNEIMKTGDFRGISLEQAEKLLEVSDYDSLDFDVERVEPKNFIGEPKARDLPALDKAGVKAAAVALQDLYKARSNYTKLSMGDMITSIPHTTMHKLLDVREKELVDVLKEIHSNYDNVIDYAIESFWNDQFEYYDLVDAAAKGIMEYITKSVSGIKQK